MAFARIARCPLSASDDLNPIMLPRAAAAYWANRSRSASGSWSNPGGTTGRASGRPFGSPGVNRATSSLSRNACRAAARAGSPSGRSQAAGSAYRHRSPLRSSRTAGTSRASSCSIRFSAAVVLPLPDPPRNAAC